MQPRLNAAQRLIQADPLHEEGYLTLMRLYALNNERARALRTYQDCAALLQRELDIEPGPALHAAYERLQHMDALDASHPLPGPWRGRR